MAVTTQQSMTTLEEGKLDVCSKCVVDFASQQSERQLEDPVFKSMKSYLDTFLFYKCSEVGGTSFHDKLKQMMHK